MNPSQLLGDGPIQSTIQTVTGNLALILVEKMEILVLNSKKGENERM